VDVSELRKRILHALDAARKDASRKREARDSAERQWERFLSTVAVPLFRQTCDVLRAEKHLYSVETPAASVRLASDASPETYLELVLDAAADEPRIVGRLSLSRGRGRHVIEEHPIAPGKPLAEIGEDDLSRFLVVEIPRLVVRS
jgi:hypothetical protein